MIKSFNGYINESSEIEHYPFDWDAIENCDEYRKLENLNFYIDHYIDHVDGEDDRDPDHYILKATLAKGDLGRFGIEHKSNKTNDSTVIEYTVMISGLILRSTSLNNSNKFSEHAGYVFGKYALREMRYWDDEMVLTALNIIYENLPTLMKDLAKSDVWLDTSEDPNLDQQRIDIATIMGMHDMW